MIEDLVEKLEIVDGDVLVFSAPEGWGALLVRDTARSLQRGLQHIGKDVQVIGLPYGARLSTQEVEP